MSRSSQTPPRNAQRIFRVEDLPKDRRAARYQITRKNGETSTVILHKRRRQILELLMRGPVFCASLVRVSDIVCILKHECGLEVETVFFPGEKVNGAGDFGIYFLRSQVTRLDAQEVTA